MSVDRRHVVWLHVAVSFCVVMPVYIYLQQLFVIDRVK